MNHAEFCNKGPVITKQNRNNFCQGRTSSQLLVTAKSAKPLRQSFKTGLEFNSIRNGDIRIKADLAGDAHQHH